MSCGRQQQPVRPSAPQGRRGCLVLSGTPAAWPERKGGHCLLGQNYCSIVWPRPAWLLPGLCPLPALGVFRIPDLSAPAPNPSPAAPLGDRGPSRRVSAFRSSPEAPATPLGLRSIGSFSQGRCPPHPHPSSAPSAPPPRSRAYRDPGRIEAPHSCPARTSRVWAVCLRPPGKPKSRTRQVAESRSSSGCFCPRSSPWPGTLPFVGPTDSLSTTPPPAWAKPGNSAGDQNASPAPTGALTPLPPAAPSPVRD